MSARSGLVGKILLTPFHIISGQIFHRLHKCKTTLRCLQTFLVGVPIFLYRLAFLWLPSRCQRFGKGQLHSEGPQHGIDAAKVGNVALKVSMATDGNGLLGWLTKRLPGSAGSNWTSEPLQTSILYLSGPWKNWLKCHEKEKDFFY